MHTFTLRFDELPLAIVNGIEAAYVSGQAEIQMMTGGYFNVGDVDLEGFGERVNGKRQWPMVPAPDAIAPIIRVRLYNEWRQRVLTAALEHIEDAA